MTKIVVTEQQLKQIINEEFGIAEMVIQTAKEVFSLIVKDAKNRDCVKERNCIVYDGSVETSIIGQKVLVSYKYYSFDSNGHYEYAIARDLSLRDAWSVYCRGISLMSVSVCGVNGQIDEKYALDCISHEIEHLYQQMMQKKIFSSSTVYFKARQEMESTNESRRAIARLIYGCFKSEQEGYVNGLYMFAMSQPLPYNVDLIKSSDCWKLYCEMKDSIELLKIDSDAMKILKEYRISFKKISICLNNFLHRIGRMAAKIKKDKEEKQNWRQ